eukprot:TRINITY_DN633_c1_g1_i10.p5 TRINITY_DN633_c1_g1~~TRINITY_DN633_c1_g1_i10.p5  ORF type:complete len:143 (-),score=1.21 TRINITY_DN633_c1_g1_i10:770-1198(-)
MILLTLLPTYPKLSHSKYPQPKQFLSLFRYNQPKKQLTRYTIAIFQNSELGFSASYTNIKHFALAQSKNKIFRNNNIQQSKARKKNRMKQNILRLKWAYVHGATTQKQYSIQQQYQIQSQLPDSVSSNFGCNEFWTLRNEKF